MDTVVLVSGRGSNLRAICAAIDEGRCGARIVGVVSDRRKAAALEFAADRGIPTKVVPLKKGDDRNQWNVVLQREVASFQPQLVVLAGFMRILGGSFVEAFRGRIINVHPALLPAFPGHDGPSAALRGGVRISGCTVHVVDDGVDTGPIIAQAAVPVLTNDTRDTLHARIQVQEHRLLPEVVAWIARGDIELDPLRVNVPSTDAASALLVPSRSS
ncbi:MAG: phosphoribosylglycinamide formyltransferase [Myxococcota bacterium]